MEEEYDKNGVILLTAPCNGSNTHDWFVTFSEREVESVSLHRIWMSGHAGYGFETDEHPFVPSFDSKEKGIYITSFVFKKPGEPDIRMVVKYDHNTGTATTKGEGFDNVMIRIKMKPKAK